MCKFSTISLVGQTIGPFYSMIAPKNIYLLNLCTVYLDILQGEVLDIVGMNLRITRSCNVDILKCEILKAVLVDGTVYIKHNLAIKLDIAQHHIGRA